MIQLNNVTKVFTASPAEVRAVNDLTLSIPRGEFWSIIGPSGSGKSTVLHLIAGLTAPTSGTIWVDDVNVVDVGEEATAELRRRKIGYVLQQFSLLPFLTAWDNVAMPLVLEGTSQAEIRSRVDRSLALVNMSHRAKHRPRELSGGEQQRVAIARALVINPSVILADEPTGNLDRAAGKVVMDLIQEVNEKTGVTILLVTHDPSFAARAHKVVRLVDGTIDQEMTFPSDADQSPIEH